MKAISLFQRGSVSTIYSYWANTKHTTSLTASLLSYWKYKWVKFILLWWKVANKRFLYYIIPGIWLLAVLVHILQSLWLQQNNVLSSAPIPNWALFSYLRLCKKMCFFYIVCYIYLGFGKRNSTSWVCIAFVPSVLSYEL